MGGDNNVNGKRPTSIKYVLKVKYTDWTSCNRNVTTNEVSHIHLQMYQNIMISRLINYTLEEEPEVVEDGLKFYKK